MERVAPALDRVERLEDFEGSGGVVVGRGHRGLEQLATEPIVGGFLVIHCPIRYLPGDPSRHVDAPRSDVDSPDPGSKPDRPALQGHRIPCPLEQLAGSVQVAPGRFPDRPPKPSHVPR